ncbi:MULTISPECIES: DUF1028 domain-containing protein [Variovorax]|uniref:Ntn-hydrolase superfamily protein n=1 Tax=Variovorax paradoxus TaxID=34073 RepID=A0AAE4BYJ5_VARPD|nr:MULTISPECIES: DUF1028 domain-containing protein [Variovorax]MDR6427968.1 putative Ntn-hydrolase superfamily protein [Variovorax paradoxus]RTD88567.1 DUF1028 domain-containing protein [Variovorax sp. 369]
MTYTVIGRCPRTHQMGIAVATYSIAFGSFTQGAHSAFGVVMSQANGRRANAPLGQSLLQQGLSSKSVLATLVQNDPHESHRQIAVMTRNGSGAVHTGASVQGWAGAKIGADYTIFGNVLAGEHVLTAMEASFQEAEEQPLVERLIRALESGRDAGGQASKDRHVTERSAGVVVMDRKSYAAWDLRVDLHGTAVEELRRIYSLYKPYQPYYEDREEDPSSCPTQMAWERENLTDAQLQETLK